MPRTPFLRTATVAAVLGALLLFGQASFSRSAGHRTVTVHAGDTLWGLSIRYGVNMDQLAALNGMRLSDLLLIGRVLQIPGVGTTSSDSDSDTASAARSASPSTPQAAVGGSSRAAMRNFCAGFVPPSGPVGDLPSFLLSHPERLSLRPLFVKWARADGIPASIVEAIGWQESGWQNDAVSSADAQGIGQLLPDTAAFVSQYLIGVPLKTSVPEDNIRMSARYLAFLYRATGGNLCKTVASYYQGLGTTRRIGLLPETQVYVRSVFALRPRFL